MGSAQVTIRIEVPAPEAWACLSWFGVAKLAEGTLFGKVEFEGETATPGAIRVLHLHNALPVRERLESVSEEDMTTVYRVVDSGSMPVIDYVGQARVTPCGPKACHVKINCSFSAVGITDEDWQIQWESMERQLVEDLRDRLEKR